MSVKFSPALSSAVMPKRFSVAATRVARPRSGGDQGTAGAGRLQRIAQRHGDGGCFLLFIAGAETVNTRKVEFHLRLPGFQSGGWEQRLGETFCTRRGNIFWRRPKKNFFAPHAQSRQQTIDAGGGMAVIQIFPGLCVKVPIIAGQNNHTFRQRGDHAGQPGERRVGGGGDEPDFSRRRIFAPGFGLGIDQCGLPLGGVKHSHFGQDRRPRMGDDFQKFERCLPVLGKFRCNRHSAAPWRD